MDSFHEYTLTHKDHMKQKFVKHFFITRASDKIITTKNDYLVKVKMADKLDNNRSAAFSTDEEKKKAREKTEKILIFHSIIRNACLLLLTFSISSELVNIIYT